MISLVRGLVAGVAILISFASNAADDQQVFRLTQAKLLETQATGYDRPPAELTNHFFSGDWSSVTLPHALERKLLPDLPDLQHHGGPTTLSWYHLEVPNSVVGNAPWYIYIPRWKTDGQIAVYGDNRLLYQSNANVYWNGWNIPLWIPLNATADQPIPHSILIRIERPRNSGGGISSVWVGPDSKLSWRYQLRYLLQAQLPYMSSLAFLVAGAFSFFIWIRQRREQLYLLFFLASVAAFLRTLHYHVGENRLLMSEDWFSWVTVNSLFWLVAIAHLFINHLHGQGSRPLTITVWALTVAITTGTLPAFPSLPSVYLIAPQAYILLLLIGITVGVYGYFQSHRQGSQDGKLLSSWCLIGMLLWLYDWLLQTNRIDIEGIYVGPYMNLVGFVVFLFIMFRRYVGALEAVREVNSSLEVRLKEKETELLKQHDQLREGERKQTLTTERQRLMQDMHDGMGSSLRSALLAIERGSLGPESLAEVLKDCIDDLKLAIDAMEPVQADLLLLLATLRYRLGPRLEAAGISLLWDVKDVPALNWLDPTNALHILRIIQESFSNIIKHTEASEIHVSTRSDQIQVVVTISDNGCGFDVSKLDDHHGRGLSNQRKRADSIRADIQWQSDKTGTTLTLLLPIERRLKTREGSKN